MANINLMSEREARLKAFARKNNISLSFLVQRIADAFLEDPTIFLNRFTINSEIHIVKQSVQTDEQPAEQTA